MMLREGVRRHLQRLFSQLVAEFSGGMACRALAAKGVQRVQRSGDTAVPTAQACWDTQTEPTGATAKTGAAHALLGVYDVVGVGV